MLHATIVSTQTELEQIQKLNHQNLKPSLSPEELSKEGFVSWFYSLELLEKMHQLAPSIIVKDNKELVGYALTALKAAGNFHHDLQSMISNIQLVEYQGKPLANYNFYLMGQICIHKDYRGKGIFDLLYQHHKLIYSRGYELLVTEISANNKRSLRAHEKLGFKTTYTYTDNMDEWKVVVWDWI
jgi:GNAT superfamily N-acetyltransferase